MKLLEFSFSKILSVTSFTFHLFSFIRVHARKKESESAFWEYRNIGEKSEDKRNFTFQEVPCICWLIGYRDFSKLSCNEKNKRRRNASTRTLWVKVRGDSSRVSSNRFTNYTYTRTVVNKPTFALFPIPPPDIRLPIYIQYDYRFSSSRFLSFFFLLFLLPLLFFFFLSLFNTFFFHLLYVFLLPRIIRDRNLRGRFQLMWFGAYATRVLK